MSVEGAALSLNLPIPGIQMSQLLLAVRADDLVFVSNTSPARITSSKVGAFAGGGGRLAR